MVSSGKGVMKPREPRAKDTSGGTGPVPSSAPVHSTVPSPPSVTTRSSLSASCKYKSEVCMELLPIL